MTAESAPRPAVPAGGAAGTASRAGDLLPRSLLILIALAAGWLALSGMQELAGLIVPAFLALNLMIAAHPVGRALGRLGVPRAASALATMFVVLAALVAFFLLIGWAVVQLVQELPGYGDQFNALLSRGLDVLSRLGVRQDEINQWLAKFNFSSLFGVLTQTLSSISSIGGLLAAAFATIVFFGLDAMGLPERLEVLGRTRPTMLNALMDFAHSVRTYWVVTTAFGAVVAVIDGIALALLGVPLPAVWAVLLFLCNYIPNIGFIFAMIPPTLMALLDEGPWTAVLVVAICTAVAMLLQGLVQPRVTGRAVGVSASVSFLSVLFWSWVLGAAGALLSVPMTLLVKELLVDADPRARWLNAFLAADPATAEETPARRLAEDPDAPDPVVADDAPGIAGGGTGASGEEGEGSHGV